MKKYKMKIRSSLAIVFFAVVVFLSYSKTNYKSEKKPQPAQYSQPLSTVCSESDCVIVSAGENGQTNESSLLITSPRLIGSWPRPEKAFTSVCKRPEDAVLAVSECKAKGFDEIRLSCTKNLEIYEAIIKAAREKNIKIAAVTLAGCEVAIKTAADHS